MQDYESWKKAFASNIKALHNENPKDAHDYWHKIKDRNQGM